MTSRQDRRRRQKSGVEYLMPHVLIEPLVKWLVWEGLLAPEAANLSGKQYKEAVTLAVANHLWTMYSVFAEPSNDPPARCSRDFPADCFSALRDGALNQPIIGRLASEPPAPYSKFACALIKDINSVLRDATTLSEEPSAEDIPVADAFEPWFRGDAYEDQDPDLEYEGALDES
jgi:hypothetical protein